MATKAKSKKAASAKARPAARVVAKKPVKRRIVDRRQPETLRLNEMTPSLVVNDLERSIRFYTEGLGFVVHERWTTPGMPPGAVLKAGTVKLMLGQDDFAKGRDRAKGVGHRLWLETRQDVDALAARAKALGLTLEAEVQDLPWGSRAFAISDPDGFKITIGRRQ